MTGGLIPTGAGPAQAALGIWPAAASALRNGGGSATAPGCRCPAGPAPGPPPGSPGTRRRHLRAGPGRAERPRGAPPPGPPRGGQGAAAAPRYPPRRGPGPVPSPPRGRGQRGGGRPEPGGGLGRRSLFLGRAPANRKPPRREAPPPPPAGEWQAGRPVRAAAAAGRSQ